MHWGRNQIDSVSTKLWKINDCPCVYFTPQTLLDTYEMPLDKYHQPSHPPALLQQHLPYQWGVPLCLSCSNHLHLPTCHLPPCLGCRKPRFSSFLASGTKPRAQVDAASFASCPGERRGGQVRSRASGTEGLLAQLSASENGACLSARH